MKLKRKIIIIIGIVLIVASVCLNLYWVSQNYITKFKDDIYKQGFNEALNLVIDKVNQNGQVQIGDIILEPKTVIPD